MCGIHRRRLISGKKWFGFVFQEEPKITVTHELCDEHNYWGKALYWEPKPEQVHLNTNYEKKYFVAYIGQFDYHNTRIYKYRIIFTG